MNIRGVMIAILALFGWATMACAQSDDAAWLQLEAVPTLTEAQDRARAYATLFPDVAGFQIAEGWYALALGPNTPEQAAGRLSDLKRAGSIPRDAFITDSATHRQQFWPIGQTDAATAAAAAAEDATATDPAAPLGADTAAADDLASTEGTADETVQEAKASEATLSRDDRKALQTAMAWYGFYGAAVDGSFGAGTRESMAAWQGTNGFDATGVLTTAQRGALLANYQADQAEFGFETISEPEAGIEITLPTAMVQFDHYEPPFVHYVEKNGSGLRVILISEPGDEISLSGLYDLMQTLEVVPADGIRSQNRDSFEINAQSAAVRSYAFAQTENNMVKGYLIVWNPADAARIERILPVMKASFHGIGDTALDPGLVSMDDATRAGLLSGLEVKTPKLSGSGFFVDAAGAVVTTTDIVAQCGKITLDHDTNATILAQDAATGLAILSPATPLAPTAYAQLQTTAGRIGGAVAVAGYSYGDKLPAPVLTFGTLEDITGLNGEAGVNRLAIPVLAGDAGGPVLDASGAVIGMLLPPALNGAKVLPDGVAFAANADVITTALVAAGLTPSPAATTAATATPDALNAAGLGMAVLVSCWE